MENYETLRMPELKALARERRLRGCSRLRKAELIEMTETSTDVYLGTAEGTTN